MSGSKVEGLTIPDRLLMMRVRSDVTHMSVSLEARIGLPADIL